MFLVAYWSGKFNLLWNEFQICIFGTIANILNIIILTRKEMTKTPINAILKCKFIGILINFCDAKALLHCTLSSLNIFPLQGLPFATCSLWLSTSPTLGTVTWQTKVLLVMRMQLQSRLKIVITHGTELSRTVVHLAHFPAWTKNNSQSTLLQALFGKEKWKIRFQTALLRRHE